jgi:hypothetical protein
MKKILMKNAPEKAMGENDQVIAGFCEELGIKGPF